MSGKPVDRAGAGAGMVPVEPVTDEPDEPPPFGGESDLRIGPSSRPTTGTILRVLATVLLAAGLLWVLYELAGVLLLLVLALFFGYLIAPLVDLVENRGHVGRAPAIGVVYLLVFGAIGTAANALLPLLTNQLTQLAAQAPSYVTHARTTFRAWTWFINPARYPSSVREPLQSALGRTMEGAGAYVTAALTGLLGLLAYLPWLVLIPILAFFLLKDATYFTTALLRLLPAGAPRARAQGLLQDLDRALAAYIRAQLLACLIVGGICTIGFFAIGVPYALVLGLLAALFEFIPLAGPLAVAVSATVVASFHSLGQALIVIAFLAVLRVVQDYVLYPRLIGRGIHLHPLAVILAILAGAELGGVAGIFLAIPVVAALSVIVRHWFALRRNEPITPQPLA